MITKINTGINPISYYRKPNEYLSFQGKKELFEATDNNDIITLNHEINNGTDINSTDDYFGHTALHIACQNNNEDAVKALLKYSNIDVNKKNDIGDAPLITASKNNSTDAIKALLKSKDLDVNITDKNGFNALHIACVKNYPDIVKELITHPKLDVNSRCGMHDFTALHLALLNKKNTRCAQELVKCKNIDTAIKTNPDSVNDLYEFSTIWRWNDAELFKEIEEKYKS